MAKTHLNKITDLARALRKKNPSKKWIDCVKMASKQLAGQSPVRKPAAKKTARKRVVAKKAAPKKVVRKAPAAKRVSVPGSASLNSITSQGIKLLEAKLGKVSVSHALATTKRDKRTFAKSKAEIVRNIRKLKTIK